MTDATQPTARRGISKWLDERYDLQSVQKFMDHKEVPYGSHSPIWYLLGGMTLFFFVVQIVSGILLLIYYQPGENTSYESLRFITTKVPFGWLVRSVHCWSAHLMILTLLVHGFSALFMKAYRKPRELTWVTGCILLALALGFGFSGYLLPWNKLAFAATTVGTESVKYVPGIGEWMLQVMRGGPEVSIDTVYRFFGLHIVVLPLLAFGLIGVHLLFIQRQGSAPPVGEAVAPRKMKFFPNFMLRDVLLWVLCITALAVLTLLLTYGPGIPGVDWELGEKANPLAPAAVGIKPEWYFLWIYQLLKEFPAHFGPMEGPQAALIMVTLLLGSWFAIPWLDRKARREEHSPGFTDFGIGALLFLFWLTLKAWDIGGGKMADGTPDPVEVAATTSWIILGLGAVLTAVRFFLWKHRWFAFTATMMIHAVLHGPVRMEYLPAFAIAGVVGGGIAVLYHLRAKRSPTSGAHA